MLGNVRQHVPNVAMIDDYWLRVKKHYPMLIESQDWGYLFGYVGARWDDAGDEQ